MSRGSRARRIEIVRSLRRLAASPPPQASAEGGPHEGEGISALRKAFELQARWGITDAEIDERTWEEIRPRQPEPERQPPRGHWQWTYDGQGHAWRTGSGAIYVDVASFSNANNVVAIDGYRISRSPYGGVRIQFRVLD